MSNATPQPAHTPPAQARRTIWSRVWTAGQFVLALVATLAALAYLLLVPAAPVEPPAEAEPAAAARSVGPGLIKIAPDTPLGKKLQVVTVQPVRGSTPLLTVTGTVVASLRPGSEKVASPALMAVTGTALVGGRGSDFWQFNAPEVLSAFTDWQKSIADIAFAKGQRIKIRDAAIARTLAQQELVDTVANLVTAGTETRKQLAIERATLRQYEIQESREIYEADTAVRMAERNEAALVRQLQQAGLDPAMLTSFTTDLDIVMADVPESFLDRVRVGDGCKARFFGVPRQIFPGQVRSIAPVIAKERRTLRVLFTIADPNAQLHPGMFAEIGLSTDERDILMAPADGIIHISRTDYILVETTEQGVWLATPVVLGDVRGSQIEILNWLKPGDPAPAPGTHLVKPGDRVLGQGAILLKPLLDSDRRAAAGAPQDNKAAGEAPRDGRGEL
jgi:hypothetical protein